MTSAHHKRGHTLVPFVAENTLKKRRLVILKLVKHIYNAEIEHFHPQIPSCAGHSKNGRISCQQVLDVSSMSIGNNDVDIICIPSRAEKAACDSANECVWYVVKLAMSCSFSLALHRSCLYQASQDAGKQLTAGGSVTGRSTWALIGLAAPRTARATSPFVLKTTTAASFLSCKKKTQKKISATIL